MSLRIRDSLAVIHQRTLELIVRGAASLQEVLDALCDGIDALDPDLISSVLLADADGQHLWPAAGRRVPEDYKQLITPLPIATAGVVVVTLVAALSGVDVDVPRHPHARARGHGCRV